MGGNEVLVVFSSQTRFVYQRLFVSSNGQESASACCSVGAALQPPLQPGGRDVEQVFGQQWRGVERP